jgi:hypothetical protein
MLNIESRDIIITDSLYVFFISTQIPNAADPTSPPKINTAPNKDASPVEYPYLPAISPTTVPSVLKTP